MEYCFILTSTIDANDKRIKYEKWGIYKLSLLNAAVNTAARNVNM